MNLPHYWAVVFVYPGGNQQTKFYFTEVRAKKAAAEFNKGHKCSASVTPLYSAPPESKWIACSERMPQVDAEVLWRFECGNDEYHAIKSASELNGTPTHWTPLPSAPKVKP